MSECIGACDSGFCGCEIDGMKVIGFEQLLFNLCDYACCYLLAVLWILLKFMLMLLWWVLQRILAVVLVNGVMTFHLEMRGIVPVIATKVV